MDARMDNVRLRIQIDFGVGDVMVPGPRMIESGRSGLRTTSPLVRIPEHAGLPDAHAGVNDG